MSLPNSTPASVSRAMQIIENRTGLAAGTRLRSNLLLLLRQLSADDLEEFIERLQETNTASTEWQMVINALTIGESYFMRDKRHFKLLRESILPRLAMEKRRAGKREINVWCVGCSTGEEPYSIAITLRNFLIDRDTWSVNIIGTDINASSIESAEKGVYREWSFRHTTEQFQQQYFEHNNGDWQIHDEIREMVTFHTGNILETPPLMNCDLIFCRNMMLYFSRHRIEYAEDKLYSALRPHGWLVLGHAETLRFRRERWVLHVFPGTPIYQKPSLSQDQHGLIIRHRNNQELMQLPDLDDSVDDEPEPSDTQPVNIQKLYEGAVASVHQDQTVEAEQTLTLLLNDDPEHAHAHTLLAAIFASRQAYPEAQAHLETAHKANPLLADAHYIKALIHSEQSQTDQQIRALKAALYCQRDHILSAYMLGTAYARQGNLSAAYRQWRKAQRSLLKLDSADFVSDLTDLRARTLLSLLNEQLGDD